MRGSIDAGVRSFNEALRHNPNMTAVYPRLARVLFAVKNDTPRSVSCLRDAIERDPRNFMPRIELASIFVDIGLDERAEQLLGEVADAPGIWGEFRKEILLNLHLYRGERQAALEIAKSISDKESLSPRDWIRHDLIFADALAKNELPELRDRLESLMSAAGTFDRDAPDVTLIGQNIPAPTLIKTYRALGEEHREETLVAAFERYIETHISGQPIQRGQIRAPVAELYLRRGDIDAALVELEPLPEQFRYNAWYVARDPDFAELQGHPRFVAITGRIDEFMRRDRQALLTAGDALPACVQR
jgi:tetratricopeptide (TPR) repeat protein